MHSSYWPEAPRSSSAEYIGQASTTAIATAKPMDRSRNLRALIAPSRLITYGESRHPQDHTGKWVAQRDQGAKTMRAPSCLLSPLSQKSIRAGKAKSSNAVANIEG